MRCSLRGHCSQCSQVASRRVQEAAAEAGPPLSGVRRGAGAVSWSAAGDQGVALQHNTGDTRYIYTLYPSSHLIHCLDILTPIAVSSLCPSPSPCISAGPCPQLAATFPTASAAATPLSSLSLSSSSGRLQSHLTHVSALLSSQGGHWTLDTGHPCTPFPCTLTL